MQDYTIGIDEVGRGPLAGPVGVGVALVRDDFDWDLLPGVTDSKKLSEKKREVIFLAATELEKEGRLDFAVSMVSAKEIDEIGIVSAIKKAMNRALKNIESRAEKNTPIDWSIANACTVKLDGGLKAPDRFVYQETIIKGDSKEKTIGLASIVAKVTRDKYMTTLAMQTEYAQYDFVTHKGYGTKKHSEAIEKHGLSDVHRRSFCRRFL